jgi:hypothetical protein
VQDIRARVMYYAAVIILLHFLPWAGAHQVEGTNLAGDSIAHNLPFRATQNHTRTLPGLAVAPPIREIQTVALEPTYGILPQEKVLPHDKVLLREGLPQDEVLPQSGGLPNVRVAGQPKLQTTLGKPKRRRLHMPTRREKVAALCGSGSNPIPPASDGTSDASLQGASLAALLAEYANRHRSATARAGHTGKYILVKDAPTNGLGNRLPGFVAGLFLALVTDRVLLCDWPKFEPYFDNAEGLDFSWTRQVERYKAWELPELWSQFVLDANNYTMWLQVRSGWGS